MPDRGESFCGRESVYHRKDQVPVRHVRRGDVRSGLQSYGVEAKEGKTQDPPCFSILLLRKSRLMRRQVFHLLEKNREGMSPSKIARALHLRAGEKSLLERSLKELEDLGAVLKV